MRSMSEISGSAVRLTSTCWREPLTRIALVTENAVDFLPLLDQRQGAGAAMTPVLVALTAGRGVGGTLHARLAVAIDAWAVENSDPYAHAHWLP